MYNKFISEISVFNDKKTWVEEGTYIFLILITGLNELFNL